MAVSVLLTWVNDSAALTGQRVEFSVDGGTTFNDAGAVTADSRELTHAPALIVAQDVLYRVVSVGAGGVEATSAVLTVSGVPADGDVVPATGLEGEVVVE